MSVRFVTGLLELPLGEADIVALLMGNDGSRLDIDVVMEAETALLPGLVVDVFAMGKVLRLREEASERADDPVLEGFLVNVEFDTSDVLTTPGAWDVPLATFDEIELLEIGELLSSDVGDGVRPVPGSPVTERVPPGNRDADGCLFVADRRLPLAD